MSNSEFVNTDVGQSKITAAVLILIEKINAKAINISNLTDIIETIYKANYLNFSFHIKLPTCNNNTEVRGGPFTTIISNA